MSFDQNPMDDQPIDREEYERWEAEQNSVECETCLGDGLLEQSAEYEFVRMKPIPCPECGGTGRTRN